MKLSELKAASPSQLSELPIEILANLMANAEAAVQSAEKDRKIIEGVLNRRFSIGARHGTIVRHDGSTEVTIWHGSKSTGPMSEFTFTKIKENEE